MFNTKYRQNYICPDLGTERKLIFQKCAVMSNRQILSLVVTIREDQLRWSFSIKIKTLDIPHQFLVPFRHWPVPCQFKWQIIFWWHVVHDGGNNMRERGRIYFIKWKWRLMAETEPNMFTKVAEDWLDLSI